MATKPNIPQEEIDLGTLFSQIGKMFSNLFNAIGDFIKFLYHYSILFLLFLRKNIIVLGITTIIGILYGLFKDFKGEPVYESEMIIETNYGSGSQLYKVIDYLNELIADKDSTKVANLLDVSLVDASLLNGLQVEAIDAEKQNLLAYDIYMQETDTIYTRDFEFKDYLQRTTETDLRLYKVVIQGKDKLNYSIFSKKFNALIENSYYKNLKEKYLSDLLFHKNEIVDNINDLDSLKKRYNEVALLQASIGKKNTDLNFSTSKSNERNFDMDIIAWSERLLKSLIVINKKILRNDTVSIIKNDFGVGVEKTGKSWLKFGVLGFLLALFILFAFKFNSYLNKYEKEAL